MKEKLSPTQNNSPLSITPEEQDKLLAVKIEDRFNNKLLTDPSNPQYQANRAVVLSLCQGDFSNLSEAKNNKERRLASGFIYWCDNFVWIQNPRTDSALDKNIPFLLWKFQEDASEEITRAIMLGHDLPIEKSRDMGLSWLIIAIFTYMWHFHAFDFLVGSQKAENVDTKGNIKTLLEKARYIITRQPEWMMPNIDSKRYNKSMLLVHPETGATFSGESNNLNFGRSDRRKGILFDEFASWEMTDRAAWQACGSTTSCRIPLSTANTRGTNCHFFTVVNNARKKENPYLRLHWTLHPVFSKDLYYDEFGKPRSPWYDKEVKRASSLSEVHQELDIDYEASMGDKIFPTFSLENNVMENLTYNPSLPLYVSWDFGLDTTALIWWQEDKSKGLFYIIDEYQNSGAGMGTNIYHYIEIVQSKEYKIAIHYGDPHSGENHSLTSGQSNASILRRHGFIFKSQRAPVKTRIAATRNIMDRVLISDTCTITIEALSSWQFIRPKTGNTSSETPQHNEYSHAGDAVTYFGYNHTIKNKPKEQRRVRRRYAPSTSGVIG